MDSTVDGQFVELKKFSDFEILNKQPYTIRKKSNKIEVRPRLANGCQRVYLNGERPYLHQLVAQQFLSDYEDGDRVTFVDESDKTNINPSNLKVIKIKKKKQDEISDEWNESEGDEIIPES